MRENDQCQHIELRKGRSGKGSLSASSFPPVQCLLPKLPKAGNFPNDINICSNVVG